MSKSKRLRRTSSLICLTPAVFIVFMFNLIQEPLVAIFLGAFEFKDYFYLTLVTATLILTTLLLNQIVFRLSSGKNVCPPANKPIISWEWALFAGVVFTYPLGLRGLGFVSEEFANTVISFATSYFGAIIFAIGVTFIWLSLIRVIEKRSKRFNRLLDKLEIVTSGETVQLIVLSAFVGVTVRFLLEVILVSQFGFTSPIL